jgi:hypothetical protein
MARNKKDVVDVKSETTIFRSYLEQVAGEAAEQAGENIVKSKFVADVLEWLNGVIGKEGVIQALNLGVASLQTFLRSKGWDQALILPAIAVIDDFFDGIKEAVRADGKLTKEGAKAAVTGTLIQQKTFASAFKALNSTERKAFAEYVNVFCADEMWAKQWRFVRSQIGSVDLLRDLMSLPVGGAWVTYLTTAFGSPPKEAAIKRFLKGILPTPEEGQAKANELAETIENDTQRLAQKRHHMNNRKRFG